MNDRFKFRAWIGKERALTAYGARYLYFNAIGGISDSFLKNEGFDEIEQCTGLKDKNGTLIYEGDILTDGANTFIVNWYDDMALFRLLYKNDNRETYCLFYPDDAASKYTVIGNIHEET